MKEAGLYQRLRRKILATFPSARIDRVENGLVDGMPDVNMCIKGKDVWLELKYIEGWPARDTTQVLGRRGLRPEQINWHIKQGLAGGTSFIVVGIGRETFVTDNEQVRDINTWTRPDWLAQAVTLEDFLKSLEKA